MDLAETLRRWRLEHDGLDGEIRRAEAVESSPDLSQHQAVQARDRARRDQLAFYLAVAERLKAGQEPSTGFLLVTGVDGIGSPAVAVVRADAVEDAGIGVTITGYLDVRPPWKPAIDTADWVGDDDRRVVYGWCIHGNAAPGWQPPAALLAYGRLIWANAVAVNHFTNRFVLLTNAPLGARAARRGRRGPHRRHPRSYRRGPLICGPRSNRDSRSRSATKLRSTSVFSPPAGRYTFYLANGLLPRQSGWKRNCAGMPAVTPSRSRRCAFAHVQREWRKCYYG